MEHACDKGAHTHRGHHKAQLGDGGVGQHLLDIVLSHSHTRGHQGRQAAHHGHHGLGLGNGRVNLVGAGDQIHARGHHGRGMNQGGNGRGARHGVREPHEEGNLGRLPRDAQKQEQGDGQQHPGLGLGHLGHLFEHLPELQRTEEPEHQEHGQQKARIAHPVDHEGLHGRPGVRGAGSTQDVHLVPEADEQEGAQTDAFPAHEQGQVTVPGHQNHHHGDKEVEIREEAGITTGVTLIAHVVVHVGDRVNVNEGTHARDHQHHGHGQGVDLLGPGDAQLADGNPLGDGDHGPFGVDGERKGLQHRDQEGETRRGHSHQGHPALPQASTDEPVHKRAQQRHEDRQGCQVEEGSTFTSNGFQEHGASPW